MTKSTPKTKFLNKKRELLVFFTVLSLIAVLLSYDFAQPSRVSVSGISLQHDRESVQKLLSERDFRSIQKSQWEQVWYKADEKDIWVTYTETGQVHSVKGGLPEIDKQDASGWTLTKIREHLGAPQQGGQGRAIGGEGHDFVFYPQHRLLVQRGESTNFVLFESGKSL